MPWPHYAGKIADGDLKALIAYLRSVKPVKNRVPAPGAARETIEAEAAGDLDAGTPFG